MTLQFDAAASAALPRAGSARRLAGACSRAARRSWSAAPSSAARMVATDRRTTGAQIDDETIEVKASSRMSETSATAATSTSPATTGWCC